MEPIKGFNRFDIVYYVEKGNIIRLIKEIKLERFKKLRYFKEIESEVEKISKSNPKSIFAKNDDLSDLHFYFLIEGEHLFDRENYVKTFFDKPLGKEEFKKEYNRILKSIENKKKKNKTFKDLEGVLFKGCYLLITNRTDKAKITPFKSNVCFSLRIDDLGRLPKEIKMMCDEYNNHVKKAFEMEEKEMEQFMRLANQDKSSLLEDILGGFINFKEEPDFVGNNFGNVKNKVKLEDVLQNKINDIENVSLLETMLSSAIDIEDYEKCSLIRDRIKELK